MPRSSLLTGGYRSERLKTEALKTQSRELDTKLEEIMSGELQSLKDAVAKSNTESEEAATTARYVILPPTYAPVFFSFADWYHVESSPRNSAVCDGYYERLEDRQWKRHQKISQIYIESITQLHAL
jgi:hypothetical protein